MKIIINLIILLYLIFPSQLLADSSSDWLKTEIDKILSAYQNENISNDTRFLMIEKTINDNFAGTGIAKFVVGEAWNGASKDLKKDYIKNFKRHLALNIASMMQGYSNQKYELLETKIDNKNKIVLIDMEIFSDTGSVIITWRVKESNS